MKRLAVLFLLLGGCAGVPAQPERRPVRNVVLMIGDGMGFSQVTLARIVRGGPLAIESLPVTGHSHTHSSDHFVTDSAAGATALASGVKTKNETIGLDAQGKSHPTLLEQARSLGKSTGLVTTSRITHATPAAFAAHATHRTQEVEVARQYLKNGGADVMLGGGAKHFDEPLLKGFKAAGYQVAGSRADLDGCAGPKVLGLFGPSHVSFVLDRDPQTPSLPDMTRKALSILSRDPDGFFLMVEGARIDMACHASDASSCARETLEFDATVQAVVDFARRDGRTLVVVTADHATGGMAITGKVQLRLAAFDRVEASVERMEKLVRESPAAVAKEAILRQVLRDHAGIEELDADEERAYWAATPGYDSTTRLGEIVSRRLGVDFVRLEHRPPEPDPTHGHDGARVPVYAFGPGQERFTGTLDNTDIPNRIRELAGYRQP